MSHPSSTKFINPFSRLAPVLIGLLIGLHLGLLGAGAFCAPRSFNPNPTHHSHPAESLSLLCSWACHVAQIASGSSPTAQWSALLLTLMFSLLQPAFTLLRTVPSPIFAPRGPPVRIFVLG